MASNTIKYWLHFVALWLVILNCTTYFNAAEAAEKNSKLTVTIFYETLCKDCVNYFSKQLTPAYSKLGKYFKLELVPYGKSQQNFTEGQWHFTCQHGNTECEYNKLHACAIKEIKVEKSRNHFLSCLMQDKEEESHLDECAKKYHINKISLDKCRHSKEGDDLLAKMGDKTRNVKPELHWYPSITFNHVYSKEVQEEAYNDLSKAICKKLKNRPKACKHHIE